MSHEMADESISRLVALCCLCIVICPRPAIPQEEDPGPVEEVTVTGYHVKRQGIDGPAPVVVFDREALEASGFNTLAEFAQFLPYNAQTFSDAGRIISTTAGTANFNLRGIGNDSTLTLINGRRIAPYGNGEFGTELFVDINAIPLSAIERIEILKDGASAIYGSDAVAGVVNIILKMDIDGLQAEGGYLTTSSNDLSELTANINGGWKFGDGSITVGLSWFDRDPLFDRDRKALADIDLTANGGRNFRSGQSSPPTVILLETGGQTFDPECPVEGPIANRRVTPSGTNSCRFNFSQFTTHIFESERIGLMLLARHPVTAATEWYGELLWSDNQTVTELAPTPLFHFVQSDHPDNPFDQDLLVAHRAVETGTRSVEIDSTTSRIVAGARGVMADWHWDFGLSWSENDIEASGHNYILDNVMQDALLGFGGPNADQYYNPFGLAPNNDPGVIESVITDTFEGARSRDQTADLLVTSSAFQLSDRPLNLAVGAQLRHMELDEMLDPLSLAGQVAGGRVGTEIHADRDVWSLFGELVVPLHESAELQFAVRHEHYDDFGGTTDPKIAASWRPAEWVRIHGSWGTSFRAPAFRELFDPLFQGVVFGVDVERCDVTGEPVDCDGQLIDFETSGNAGLDPEEGESWLLGIDLRPALVEGLSFGVDFWRFEHDNRVVLPEGEIIFKICADCILRAPQTPEEALSGIPGQLIAITSTYINADELETQGIDFDARYGWESAWAYWQIGWTHTYLDEFTFPRSLTLGDGVDFAGNVFLEPLPEHRGNLVFTWTRGIHHVAATGHYVGDYQSNNNVFIDQVETDTPFVVGEWYSVDLQYQITLERLRGATVRLGCVNCTDREPSPFNNFETRDTGLHDKRGRMVYLRWTQPF